MSASSEGKIDRSVVEALYAEHGDELRRFLLGVLRDSQLASDVMQATLAKLIERGHETREETRKAWLFRVAYHEAMLVRRRQATGDKAVRRMAWTTNAAARSTDELIIHDETIEAVRTALKKLPPEQQQVVRMRIYEDKTFAVIAKELNIPLGTALARMRSALAKLRNEIDEQQ